MTDYIGELMEYLEANQTDPVTYLVVLFLLCVATAIILPIPIEIALIWNPTLFFPIKALTLGLGKGTGAIAVFLIGAKVEHAVKRFAKWRWFNWLLVKSEAFVRRFGVFALYVLMSIPGMVDTIPLYLFSIFNQEGKLIGLRDFALINVLAGVNRAMLIFAILEIFGVELF